MNLKIQADEILTKDLNLSVFMHKKVEALGCLNLSIEARQSGERPV